MHLSPTPSSPRNLHLLSSSSSSSFCFLLLAPCFLGRGGGGGGTLISFAGPNTPYFEINLDDRSIPGAGGEGGRLINARISWTRGGRGVELSVSWRIKRNEAVDFFPFK